jgi:hypothetical protein
MEPAANGGTEVEFVAKVIMVVVLLAQLPLVGRRSLRYLRDAPDFPHKREMMRGAKWGGWLALVAAIPLTIAIWFGAEVLSRLGLVVGIGLLALQGLLLLGVGKYWPLIGYGASLKLWWEPVERDEDEWREDIERLEQWRGSWRYVVLICSLAAGTGAVIYMTYLLSEFDRLIAVFG